MPARARRRCPPPALLLGIGLAGAALATVTVRAAPPAAEESQIKAQFFERFTRFVDWPAQALGDSSSFVVCLTGASDISDEIERRMARARVKGRPAQVRWLKPLPDADPQGCHALYVVSALDRQLEGLLARTRRQPILTVSDTDGFGERGVLINMYIDQRFVRFEINASAVRDSGLQIRAQLLRLARLVKTPGR